MRRVAFAKHRHQRHHHYRSCHLSDHRFGSSSVLSFIVVVITTASVLSHGLASGLSASPPPAFSRWCPLMSVTHARPLSLLQSCMDPLTTDAYDHDNGNRRSNNIKISSHGRGHQRESPLNKYLAVHRARPVQGPRAHHADAISTPSTEEASTESIMVRQNQRRQRELLTLAVDARDEVIWSCFSNAFFVGGGLCYVLTTTWDWALGHQLVDASTRHGNLYGNLFVLGPLVYLLNAIMDVLWALRVLRIQRRNRQLQAFYRYAATQHDAVARTDGHPQHLPSEQPPPLALKHEPHDDVNAALDALRPVLRTTDVPAAAPNVASAAATKGVDETTDGDLELALQKWKTHVRMDDTLLEGAIRISKEQRRRRRFQMRERRLGSILERLQRHMGHRREITAAATFGVAAIFGLAAALLDRWMGSMTTNHLALIADAASIHIYMLSAFFVLWGMRKPTDQNEWIRVPLLDNAEALETVGDILFGIASFIDVILCDLHFDDNILLWPVMSSILWLLDALLYLRADFVVLYKNMKEPGVIVEDIVTVPSRIEVESNILPTGEGYTRLVQGGKSEYHLVDERDENTGDIETSS